MGGGRVEGIRGKKRGRGGGPKKGGDSGLGEGLGGGDLLRKGWLGWPAPKTGAAPGGGAGGGGKTRGKGGPIRRLGWEKGDEGGFFKRRRGAGRGRKFGGKGGGKRTEQGRGGGGTGGTDEGGGCGQCQPVAMGARTTRGGPGPGDRGGRGGPAEFWPDEGKEAAK